MPDSIIPTDSAGWPYLDEYNLVQIVPEYTRRLKDSLTGRLAAITAAAVSGQIPAGPNLDYHLAGDLSWRLRSVASLTAQVNVAQGQNATIPLTAVYQQGDLLVSGTECEIRRAGRWSVTATASFPWCSGSGQGRSFRLRKGSTVLIDNGTDVPVVLNGSGVGGGSMPITWSDVLSAGDRLSFGFQHGTNNSVAVAFRAVIRREGPA